MLRRLRFPRFLITVILVLIIISNIPLYNQRVYAISDSISEELNFTSTLLGNDTSKPIEIDIGDQLTNALRESTNDNKWIIELKLSASASYDYDIEIIEPYDAVLYLADIAPKLNNPSNGYLSISKKEVNAVLYAEITIYLKGSFNIRYEGLLPIISSFDLPPTNIIIPKFQYNTDEKSPLGTIVIPLFPLIKDEIGFISPSVAGVIGLGAGLAATVTFEPEIDLNLSSKILASPNFSSNLEIPNIFSISSEGAYPFDVIPISGGDGEISWSFIQTNAASIILGIAPKVTVIATAGAGITWESPKISKKIIEIPIYNGVIPSQNILAMPVSISQPQLSTTTVTSILETASTKTTTILNGEQNGNELLNYTPIGIGIAVAGLLMAAAIYTRKSG